MTDRPNITVETKIASPLLTAEEAVKYLRLDLDKKTMRAALCSLEYYRKHGELTGVKIGRNLLYRVKDLDALIARKADIK